jgi:hypothetical protein
VGFFLIEFFPQPPIVENRSPVPPLPRATLDGMVLERAGVPPLRIAENDTSMSFVRAASGEMRAFVSVTNTQMSSTNELSISFSQKQSLPVRIKVKTQKEKSL